MTAETDGRGAPSPPSPSSSPPGSFADVARLRLVIARLHRQLAQASADLDLTYAQLSALARTEERGPLRIGELALYEQVAAPSLTRTVGPLVAAGLLRKSPDPSDGRSSLVSITPAGADFLNRLRRERSAFLTHRMSQLTTSQHDALRAALPALEQLLIEPPTPSP